ncbi:MAG: hypothetical protein WD095_00290 [Candidatus Paceibacterota bacterium]
MVNTFTYTIQRVIFRATDFLKDWYIKGTKNYWHWVISKIERIDYVLALRITLKNIFTPLYKDYSVIGHIIGFFLRLSRIIIASIVYGVFLGIALALYLFWLALPILIIYQFITSNNNDLL